MNLPHNDELLSAYLDRELSPDERAAVDRWLEQSPEARDQLRELEVTSRFVRKLSKLEIGADFADGVIDQLRTESLLRPAPIQPKRTNRRLMFWVGGPIAAAATLLLAVGITLLGPRNEQRTIVRNFTLDDFSALPLLESAAEEKVQSPLELLKKGDVFGILDPDGIKQFDLIVLAKPTEPDSIMCILVGQEMTGEVTELEARVAESSRHPNSSLAIEADHKQVDQLRLVLQEANTQPETAYPVVDIRASGEMERQMLADLTLRKRAHEPNRPLQEATVANSQSPVARTEPSESTAKQPTPEVATQRRSASTESERAAKQGPPAGPIDNAEKLAASSADSPTDPKATSSRAASPSQEVGQLGRFVIQNIDLLAEADKKDLRIGKDFDKAKQPRPRAEALLLLRWQK